MKLDELKEGFASMWDSVADGWRHLTQSAAGAITRFRPGESSNLPAHGDIDDDAYTPGRSWAMLGGDVFESDDRLVIRLEIPGMEKDDIAINVRDDALVVTGEKRFAREDTEGRWRVMQCAYGSFRRVVPLPVPVLAEQAQASYRNGVLRVALPKAAPGKPKSFSVKVE
ncbi:MAG: Hsp20/alpha crystallin family protein [Gammaproteobacteria bacterium]